MRPETLSYLSPSEIALFLHIEKTIENLPDTIDLGFDQKNKEPLQLNCHILAEAISRGYKMRRIDGWYRPDLMTHSWCLTPENNLLDVYPCNMIGGPLLLLGKQKWLSEVYITERDTTDERYPDEGSKDLRLDIFERYEKEDFERAVQKVLMYF